MSKTISTIILLVFINCIVFSHANENDRLFVLNECRTHVVSLSNGYPTPLYENIDGSLKNIVAKDRNENGYLIFDFGERMIISCNGNYLLYHGITYEKIESAELVCTPDGLFSAEWIPGKRLFLPNIYCASGPSLIEIETNRSCGEEHKGNILQVAVQSALDRNHLVYEACFLTETALPLYVQYTLTNENYFSQNYPGELRYTGRSQRFVNLYVQEKYDDQTKTMNNLLGIKYWDYYKYGDELKIGQLYAQGDIIFNPLQRGTYNLINTIPQWNRINEGNWAAVKSSLKKLMNIERGVERNITIYSGGWGLLKLKNDDGIDIEISLEESPTNRLPVPLWLYQVVYEPSTRKSIAFIVLNNPHVLVDEAKAMADEFCPETVCPKDNNPFTWMEWTEQDVKKGYVHCCSFEDFKKVIKDLPDLDVSEVFP